MKNSLIDDLRSLLLDGKVTNQETLCSALEKIGHEINQSKISRLLRKIGAVKSKNEKGLIVYRLPREPAPPTLSSEVSHLIMEVEANETMIIVHTSPGSAQLVARILDYHKTTLEILGSLAGDDAILVIPTSIKTIKTSLNNLRKLLYEN